MQMFGLSAEAYGVLQALESLKATRHVEGPIVHELGRLAYANSTKSGLAITRSGIEAAREMRALETVRSTGPH